MVIREKFKYANDGSNMFKKSLILFIMGFFMVFVGVVILMVATALDNGSANFGAFIFIGPFPIVVGAGPEATSMVLFVLILAILSVIMFMVLRGEKKTANV